MLSTDLKISKVLLAVLSLLVAFALGMWVENHFTSRFELRQVAGPVIRLDKRTGTVRSWGVQNRNLPESDPNPSPPTLSSYTSPTPAAPPTWDEVTKEPSYQQATPETKLIAFDRWHNEAYNYASSLPDWEQYKDQFNKDAADTQAALSKEAGGITPDEARVKIATDAIASEQAKNPAKPLTREQKMAILQPLGDDIVHTYYRQKLLHPAWP